jgi:hypothetical protein
MGASYLYFLILLAAALFSGEVHDSTSSCTVCEARCARLWPSGVSRACSSRCG